MTYLKALKTAAAMVCLAALPAQAENISQTIIPNDASVTIYSLDDAAPIASNTAIAPTTQAYQPVVETLKPLPVQETTLTSAAIEETKEAAEVSGGNGWLGANWDGRANIGASLQTGNTEQDAVNIDASISGAWPDAVLETKHRASVKAELNLENQDDERTEDNRRLKLAYDYFFNKQWFLNSAVGFEQDDIDLVDLRTDAGIGLGHQVFDRDDLKLQYIIGPSYLGEEFANGDKEESLAGRWSLDYSQKVWDEVFELFHNHELFVPTDETDAYLINTKTGVRMPLRKGIVATAEVDFDWDNAPAAGTKEDDTTYALKVGYEW